MSDKATVETVQQQLLDAISKSLENNQHDQAAMLIGSYATLGHALPFGARPFGLDSGAACKETP